MTKQAKTKLAKLADFLENEVKPEWFYLGTWASAGFAERKCGTTACAAGWATVAFPNQGFELKTEAITYKGYTSIEAVAAFFDINLHAAQFLFLPSHYLLGKREKKHVVQRIRTLVRTGHFDYFNKSKKLTGWKS